MSTEKKRVTIHDIAQACGVSSSTVSRALNHSVLVGDEVRTRVMENAQRLGYHKRDIRKQHSRAILNIVLFLPETPSKDINLFYDVSEFVKGLNKGFAEVKANVILRINQSDDKGFHNKKLGDVDGCVFAFTMPKATLVRTITERGIPLLLVNRSITRHDYVVYDSVQAMGSLVEKVIAKNRRRGHSDVHICYVGFPPVAAINEERKRAVARACTRFGLPFDIDSDVYDVPSLTDITIDFIHTLKGRGYDAIICFNDFVAMQLYIAGTRFGYAFPGDFSLTGYDDSPALELLDRKIDTISFDVKELGFESAKVLKKRIIGRHKEPIHISLKGKYRMGETI